MGPFDDSTHRLAYTGCLRRKLFAARCMENRSEDERRRSIGCLFFPSRLHGMLMVLEEMKLERKATVFGASCVPVDADS
jgi:hypothetical protein